MHDRLLYTAAAPVEAARRLPGLPPAHPNAGLHGHGFVAHLRMGLPDDFAAFRGNAATRLRSCLVQVLDPLHYGHLNDLIDVPTDANIARWIAETVAVDGPKSVGVRSTDHSGVVLDEAGQAHVWRKFRIAAAHQLPNVPEDHKCGRMHGHNYGIMLHARVDTETEDDNTAGDGLDFAWTPLGNQLHHACLNDIPGLENPTSEFLASWIWERLERDLPSLSRVTIHETDGTGCYFDGILHRIWKDRHFESATRLVEAPEGDRRRQLHGHGYSLRLFLEGAPDDVYGWTMDFGDVKRLFDPLYRQLDHHELHHLSGIEGDGSLEGILGWIRNRLTRDLDQCYRMDLRQSPGCGAILCRDGTTPVDLTLGTEEAV